jgi:tetratricopeptide (TPR) repeat protein
MILKKIKYKIVEQITDKMKKILLSILFVGVASLANAQKSEVNAAKNAWILIANGGTKTLPESLKMLNDGLAHTDKAVADEKTSKLAEAWAYRALFASRTAQIDSLDLANSKAKQKIAEEAIAKAKSLNPKEEEKKFLDDASGFIEDAVRNRGVFAYKKKDYATALDAFNEYTTRNPKDTNMFVNAALMAKQLKNYPEVARNYKAAIGLNYPDAALLYKDLINIYLTEVKDSTAAIALIQEASAKYPGDNDLLGMETNYWIKKGDVAKSQEMIKKLIEKNPNSPDYQIAMADIFFKQANDFQDTRNKLATELEANKGKVDVKKKKEFDDLGAKMRGILDQAIPYYKAAAALDPKSGYALDKLKSIYNFKNDKENEAAVQKQLDALPK